MVQHVFRRKTTLLASVIALLAVVLTAGIASAHVKKSAGQYTLFIGFAHEPAIVEQPNGVEVLIRDGDSEDANPAAGVTGLKADVTFGGQTTTIDLEEVDGSPGEYHGDFIPTAMGSYTFRIHGSVNGTPVDQSVSSGPESFSDVLPATSLQFPNQVQPVASVEQAASDASSTADSARTLGIVGIVVGALGLLAGIGGMLMARGARASSTASSYAGPQDDVTGSTVRP